MCHMCPLGLETMATSSLPAAVLPHAPGVCSLFTKTQVKMNSMLSRWPPCPRAPSPKGMRDVQREFFPPTSWQEVHDGTRVGFFWLRNKSSGASKPFYFYKGGLEDARFIYGQHICQVNIHKHLWRWQPLLPEGECDSGPTAQTRACFVLQQDLPKKWHLSLEDSHHRRRANHGHHPGKSVGFRGNHGVFAGSSSEAGGLDQGFDAVPGKAWSLELKTVQKRTQQTWLVKLPPAVSACFLLWSCKFASQFKQAW